MHWKFGSSKKREYGYNEGDDNDTASVIGVFDEDADVEYALDTFWTERGREATRKQGWKTSGSKRKVVDTVYKIHGYVDVTVTDLNVLFKHGI